jgi:hypothetical protein
MPSAQASNTILRILITISVSRLFGKIFQEIENLTCGGFKFEAFIRVADDKPCKKPWNNVREKHMPKFVLN